MENPLTRKLEQFALLSRADRDLLDEIVAPNRIVPARSDLIREGQSSDTVRLVLNGLACRYKLLPTGERQIVGFLLPGDFCDLNAVILKAMDHSITALSECTVVDIPRWRILELTDRPGIARAFWWVTLVDEGTLREWVLNIGQRRSTQRIAYFLCELFMKLQSVGLAEPGGFALPLTQADIGDAVGLSHVHVSRCLLSLREMKLITVKNRDVFIMDLNRLIAYTGFNANYLHLGSTQTSGLIGEKRSMIAVVNPGSDVSPIQDMPKNAIAYDGPIDVIGSPDEIARAVVIPVTGA